MHRPAAFIMLAGAVFIFFSLPLYGVDLLIDAVGFLLLFNGLRPYARLYPAFGPAPAVSLGLVAVAALSLFIGGAVGAALLWALAGGSALLFLLMALGFGRGLLPAEPRSSGARAPIAALAICLGLAAPAAFFPRLAALLPALAGALDAAGLAVHLALLAALCWYAINPPCQPLPNGPPRGGDVQKR